MGKPWHFLGLEIKYMSNGPMLLTQTKYVERAPMTGCSAMTILLWCPTPNWVAMELILLLILISNARLWVLYSILPSLDEISPSICQQSVPIHCGSAIRTGEVSKESFAISVARRIWVFFSNQLNETVCSQLRFITTLIGRVTLTIDDPPRVHVFIFVRIWYRGVPRSKFSSLDRALKPSIAQKGNGPATTHQTCSCSGPVSGCTYKTITRLKFFGPQVQTKSCALLRPKNEFDGGIIE